MLEDLEPIVNRPLSDQVANAVRKLILAGNIPPGQAITEVEIASRLNVSRNPVREALLKLEQDGLVVGQPYKGFVVVDLGPDDIRDLYEVRAALEGVAVERIVRNHDRGACERLATAVEQIRQAAEAGDLWQAVDAEISFHELVCEVAGNRQLAEAYRSIAHRIRLALAFDNAAYENLRDVAVEHERLLQVWAEGNPMDAVEAMRRHIMDSTGALITSLEARRNAASPEPVEEKKEVSR